MYNITASLTTSYMFKNMSTCVQCSFVRTIGTKLQEKRENFQFRFIEEESFGHLAAIRLMLTKLVKKKRKKNSQNVFFCLKIQKNSQLMAQGKQQQFERNPWVMLRDNGETDGRQTNADLMSSVDSFFFK